MTLTQTIEREPITCPVANHSWQLHEQVNIIDWFYFLWYALIHPHIVEGRPKKKNQFPPHFGVKKYNLVLRSVEKSHWSLQDNYYLWLIFHSSSQDKIYAESIWNLLAISFCNKYSYLLILQESVENNSI